MPLCRDLLAFNSIHDFDKEAKAGQVISEVVSTISFLQKDNFNMFTD